MERREFLKIAAASFAALFLPPAVSIDAQVYRASYTPWQDKQWFPFKEGLKSDDGTALVTLHQNGGPLWIYDRVYGLVYPDHPSHAQQEQAEKANYALYESDLAKEAKSRGGEALRILHSWLGGCAFAGNFGLRENRPPRNRLVIDNVGRSNEVVIDYMVRLGLGVNLRSRDVHYSPIFRPQTAEELLYNINEFIKWFQVTEEPFMVDLPEKAGGWYRAVYGVDLTRGLVLVTNWGYGDRWMPISGIKYVYQPFLIEEAIAQGITDTEMLKLHAFWENSEIDINFARYLMVGLSPFEYPA